MKTIYKVLTGVDEIEFYTFKSPSFNDENQLVCNEIFSKMTVGRTVLNKLIKAYYPSEIEETKLFDLKDGVIIKIEDEDLNWLNNTEENANSDLDKRELELYREVIPQIQTAKKDFLIK